MRKDRVNKKGGGLLLYVKDNIEFSRLHNLETEHLETIWIKIRPQKLPRKVTAMYICVVYYPPTANQYELKQHLWDGTDHCLNKDPAGGIMILGDFNQFKDKHITTRSIKQIVKQPTRGNNILDKCYTNLHMYYKEPEIRPGIGKSDHLSFILEPIPKYNNPIGYNTTKLTRLKGHNEKTLFVHDLKKINWRNVYKAKTCYEKYEIFKTTMTELFNNHFPVKKITLHTNDKPWIDPEFKQTIRMRQYAKKTGDLLSYKRMRNKVNRLNKSLKRKYYKRSIEKLKKKRYPKLVEAYKTTVWDEARKRFTI